MNAKRIGTVALASMVVGAVPALAGFTGIGGSGEAGILINLNTLYGTGVGNPAILASGNNFENTTNAGALTFTRVEDFDGTNALDEGATNNLLSDPADGMDQQWTDGIATFSFRLRIAGYTQQFGFDETDSPASPGFSTTVFSGEFGNPTFFDINSDSPLGGGGNTIGGFELDGDFLWTRSGRGGNVDLIPQSSLAGINNEAAAYDENDPLSDEPDHLITYQVNGLPDQNGRTVWLLMWDDQDGDDVATVDRDFNDMWVEVRAIPAPGAAVLAMIGAGLLGRMRRRED